MSQTITQGEGSGQNVNEYSNPNFVVFEQTIERHTTQVVVLAFEPSELLVSGDQRSISDQRINNRQRWSCAKCSAP